MTSEPTGTTHASGDADALAAVRMSVSKALSCCAFSVEDSTRAAPDGAVAVRGGMSLWQVPFGAEHVWVGGAQDAPLAWLAKLGARKPRRVTLQGNSYAFGQPWFACLCCALGSRCAAPARVPFHALVESAREAVALGTTVRLLAANRADASLTMQALRGTACGVRVGDPVWLWKQRRVERAEGLICGARAVQSADLRATPGLRVRTGAGTVSAADVDVALVQTPATMRGRTPAVPVLPGVGPLCAFSAEQHATEALVGVGRAFAIHHDTFST